MMSHPRWIRPVVILSILINGLLPILLYWWIVGRVPTLSPQDAIALLSSPGKEAVLVDVRDAATYEARHLGGAMNWPYSRIKAMESADQVPARLKDRSLLFICNVGFLSARAARRLRELGWEDAYNVRGGLQAWVAAGKAPCTAGFCRFELASGETQGLPFRRMPGHEQWAAVIAAFVFKPLYMLLSFGLALILWRHHSRDMVALRWGLVLFFVGEGFCAVNYLFLGEDSYLVEYLHSYGMVLALALTCYAVLEGLDSRVVRVTDPGNRCAALQLCGSCIKHVKVPCGARRVFALLIWIPVILAVIPLLAVPNEVSYNTKILGTVYHYSHGFIYQIFETRYCPTLAVILFAISFLLLLVRKDETVPETSKVTFSAGMGALGFSMFRLVFVAVYGEDLVWYVFWEELTELLYVAMVGGVLWIFRRGLFRERGKAEASARRPGQRTRPRGS